MLFRLLVYVHFLLLRLPLRIQGLRHYRKLSLLIMVYVSVMDLGAIFGSEWEIIVINDFPFGPDPFGFGFSNCNTTSDAGVQTILEDDTWVGVAMAYIWQGDGTQGYLSLTSGFQDVKTLTTAPAPHLSDSESVTEQNEKK